MNRPGLALLAGRRVAPLALVLAFLLLVFLAARRGWSPPPALTGEEGSLAVRAFVRQGIWAVFAVFVAPVLILRTSVLAARYRERDVDWLAPLPVSRARIVWSLWSGGAAAALLLVLTTSLLAEVAAGGDSAPTQRLIGTLDNPPTLLFEGDPPHSWQQRDDLFGRMPAGTRVRFRPTVAPGSGPAVSVRFALASTSPGAERASVEERIYGRSALELELPADLIGYPFFTVERRGAGAALLLPARSIDVLVPAGSERGLAWELALRVALALVVWIALALGLGAWVRPWIAAGLVFATAAAAWRWGIGAGFAPGADWPATWHLLGTGVLPPHLDWRNALGAMLSIGFALALANAGFARGKGTP